MAKFKLNATAEPPVVGSGVGGVVATAASAFALSPALIAELAGAL